MDVRKLVAIVASVLGCTHAWSAGHCGLHESTFFSCPVRGGKVVSVCGGPDWLQYRFGRVGRIELAFPPEKAGSLQQFTGASRFHKAAQVSTEFLMFERANAQYFVTQMDGGAEFNGVSALVPGAARVAELQCTSHTSSVRNLRAAVDMVPEGNP